ncbi:MAG: hypothetical protein WCP09_01460 [Candidatus Taylorbacteria bacterium]
MEWIKNFIGNKSSAQWAFDLSGWMLVVIIICVVIFFLGFTVLSGLDILGIFILYKIVYMIIPLFAVIFILASATSIWLGIHSLVASGERIKSVTSIILSVLIFIVSTYTAWIVRPAALNGGQNFSSEAPRVTPSISQDLSCTTEIISNASQAKVVKTKCNKTDPIHEFLTINGAQQKTYSTIDKITISPDGKKIAYVGHIKGKDGKIGSYLIVDGVEYELTYPNSMTIFDGEEYNMAGFSMREIVFSPDSQHIAYIIYAFPTSKKYIAVDIYRDGVMIKRYDIQADCKSTVCTLGVEDLKFSKNNKLAYILYRSESNTKSIVIDGMPNKLLYTDVGKYAVSPDGSHFVYVGHEKNSSYLVIDANIFKSFPYSEKYTAPDLEFSDDGTTICYTRGTSQSGAYLAYKIVNNKEKEFPFDSMKFQDFSNFCNY